jgi:hypothetical protein
MARPTKDDTAKRSERFNLRLTLAELAHVQAQAAHAGIGAHDYARRRVLGHRVPPARSQIDATLLSDLNRIGVNLNQLARASNSGADVQAEAAVLLAQVRGIIEQIGSGDGS